LSSVDGVSLEPNEWPENENKMKRKKNRNQKESNMMDRWRLIRLIKDCEHSRKSGSLGRIGLHLTDVTSVNLLDLMRALSLELGREVADQYGTNLHHAFSDSSSSSSVVDVRHIIATYRAMTLATDAFHHPEMVLLKLLETYLIEGCNTKSWLLADIVNVATIAAANDEEEEYWRASE
jgi:hypothetical protein